MNTLRLPYQTLSPDAYKGFGITKKALEKSSLGKPLIELVYLRVSQLNGAPSAWKCTPLRYAPAACPTPSWTAWQGGG
ncbi:MULTISPECIES: carboxymuconolactone decarboxylase family protein [Xanthomonas]|uniref:Uncharacterized protein n=1 Tax=Xanthomonas arboricola TaxID=56448 RepID=A0AB73GZX0_9XANT|nr:MULTISPECIES: carboxymuconolactone decarboxylase family protein [Xanthomonas]MBB3798638.1 hypothetical protein [Xanthomonas arboricola]MBB4771169.1 hypothetical protein [Xanthomonas arboricola]MBB5671337.1 hypothetical protein [Xanthomonas arboricola]MBB5675323.1 hypothetical protein [Xanthomonas arboricola]MCC8668476.1 carboxymuconolactone decarboxylase family protein [Xanthomonas arboricola]